MARWWRYEAALTAEALGAFEAWAEVVIPMLESAGDQEAADFGRDRIAQSQDARLAATAQTPAPLDRLDLHDELAYAEHEVAARLHRYLWGDTPHQTEPDDGSDCQMCYDETNGLLYYTISKPVAAAYAEGEPE